MVRPTHAFHVEHAFELAISVGATVGGMGTLRPRVVGCDVVGSSENLVGASEGAKEGSELGSVVGGGGSSKRS